MGQAGVEHDPAAAPPQTQRFLEPFVHGGPGVCGGVGLEPVLPDGVEGESRGQIGIDEVLPTRGRHQHIVQVHLTTHGADGAPIVDIEPGLPALGHGIPKQRQLVGMLEFLHPWRHVTDGVHQRIPAPKDMPEEACGGYHRISVLVAHTGEVLSLGQERIRAQAVHPQHQHLAGLVAPLSRRPRPGNPLGRIGQACPKQEPDAQGRGPPGPSPEGLPPQPAQGERQGKGSEKGEQQPERNVAQARKHPEGGGHLPPEHQMDPKQGGEAEPKGLAPLPVLQPASSGQRAG
jgi:hypothetical protein